MFNLRSKLSSAPSFGRWHSSQLVNYTEPKNLKIQRNLIAEEVIDFIPVNSIPIMKLDELWVRAQEFGKGILTLIFSSKIGSLNQFISNIDYSIYDPHEEHALNCAKTSLCKPICISFITYELKSLRSQLLSDNSIYATNKVARIDKMLIWLNALSVIPNKKFSHLVGNAYWEATIFSSYKASGISNADLAIAQVFQVILLYVITINTWGLLLGKWLVIICNLKTKLLTFLIFLL